MDTVDLHHLRAVPLASVLEALGARRDPKDPAHNWRVGSLRLTIHGERFFDHTATGATHRLGGRAGGGGALDLVQYLADVPFTEAARRLTELATLAPPPATPVAAAAPAPGAPSIDHRPAPTPDAARLPRVRWYLTQVRALPSPLVDGAIASGRLFADRQGNAVFRLRDDFGRDVGFELRGTHDVPFHSVHGQKGLFFAGSARHGTAAFVESAIDALSYRALYPDALVVSTTGHAVDLPIRMAQRLAQRGFAIRAAFDADRDGDRMAERLREALPGAVTRHRPEGAKDWNALLQAREIPASGRRADAPRLHEAMTR